ncbi:MAG: hypothetical protein KY475_09035, partial [Planctomycetes bacterium]|nr:hypothetical protein [Planctomycetota bacterium]
NGPRMATPAHGWFPGRAVSRIIIRGPALPSVVFFRPPCRHPLCLLSTRMSMASLRLLLPDGVRNRQTERGRESFSAQESGDRLAPVAEKDSRPRRARGDERWELTEIGRHFARLPVDPRIGRTILAGAEEGSLHEVLIIAAALELRDPRERPADRQQAADEKHAQFADEQSDFLSYLKLWDFYHHLKETHSRNQLHRTCRENLLSHNRLREWADIHRQLQQMTRESGLKPGPRRDEYNASLTGRFFWPPAALE